MADKGKKGKPGEPAAAPAPGAPPPGGMSKDGRREKEWASWGFCGLSPLPWLRGHVSRQICLIGSLVMFTGTTIHPILTLIITMEISIFIFFILIYTFAIQRYMPFILWPISDLLNDLFCCAFLVGASVFAIKSRKTVPVNYVAAAFLGVAALFALIDVCLQRKHFKGKKVKRNVLVPPPSKEAEKGKDEGKPKDAAKGKPDAKGKPEADKGKAPPAKGGKK
uniref:CKLF-like MARVEL transmembrane domain-containing protein 2 n=1 Tax=Moschus moschiferus TaxID=68415 RepID=A0A8C6CR51_MOSMO